MRGVALAAVVAVLATTAACAQSSAEPAPGSSSQWNHWASNSGSFSRRLAGQGWGEGPSPAPEKCAWKPTSCTALPREWGQIPNPSCSKDPCQAEPDCKKYYNCFPGWADCNGKADDLCEAFIGLPWAGDLNKHSKNCGGCGVDCDQKGEVCGVKDGTVQCVKPGHSG